MSSLLKPSGTATKKNEASIIVPIVIKVIGVHFHVVFCVNFYGSESEILY